jgi:hypothetical protein
MVGYREFRFEIAAGYTAETMPLGRLAVYLQELAVVLGDERHIHLLKVESSSAVPVFLIEEEAAPRVRERASAVKRGAAPAEAMRAYRAVNRMLREDRGRASFSDETAEIIPFPGVETPAAEPISGVSQQGTLDGQLEKIGGPKEWVPIHLRTMAKELISGCFARRALSQELAPLIYKPVRLYGRGHWGRSIDGHWAVERFLVDSFEPLNQAPLTNIIANLRKISSDWSPAPIAVLNTLRHGNGEDE